MPFTETSISDVWIHSPIRYSDARGSFEEQFKVSQIEKDLGRTFSVQQVNQSQSRAGVLRGIHWTTGLHGQAKYVSCTRGKIWDVVVDFRNGSPTFGQWTAEYLSRENGKSVFIPEGMGHAFLALEDGTVVNYLCTAEYEPILDETVDPLDLELAIPFERIASEHELGGLVLSHKDATGIAFSISEANRGRH